MTMRTQRACGIVPWGWFELNLGGFGGLFHKRNWGNNVLVPEPAMCCKANLWLERTLHVPPYGLHPSQMVVPLFKALEVGGI